MKTYKKAFRVFRAASCFVSLLCLLAGIFPARAGSPPVVTGVTAAQHASTDAHPKYVDISYTISDPNFTSVNVYVLVSKDSGATWNVPAQTFISGSAVGAGVAVTATPAAKTITWDAGADWDGHFTANCRVRVLANNVGLVVIPPGTFAMGNAINDSDLANNLGTGQSDCTPHTVTITQPYYMDANLVSGGLWSLVKSYADANGYAFDNPGSFKAANHPVQSINWYDAIRWCNARSQREGLSPFYQVTYDGGATWAPFGSMPDPTVAGSFLRINPSNTNGYRLPTEAEWEKAARGGAAGHRFPWSDTDHISESRADYFSLSSTYDDSNTGYNTAYTTGDFPYTSPVGSFAPNAYGLYDMAGNVFEWCGDWYSGSYYAPGQIDPQGPSSGVVRVTRGSSWEDVAGFARCACRTSFAPASAFNNIGFRCARGL